MIDLRLTQETVIEQTKRRKKNARKKQRANVNKQKAQECV